MGIVGSVAKRIWNGIKYYVGRLREEINREIEQIANIDEGYVTTYISGVRVLENVKASIVSGLIIGLVLNLFPLGFLAGILIFLGLYLTNRIIFGRNSGPDDEDNNEDNNEEDEQTNNYINVNYKDKPNFDEPIRKKKDDLTDDFLKDVNSYLKEIEENFFGNGKKCIYLFKYNEENNEINIEATENEVDEVSDDNMISSIIYFTKGENYENYKTMNLEFINVFKDGNEDKCKNILSKVVDKLEKSIPNDYSLIISEQEANQFNNITINELSDPSTLLIILQKKEIIKCK